MSWRYTLVLQHVPLCPIGTKMDLLYHWVHTTVSWIHFLSWQYNLVHFVFRKYTLGTTSVLGWDRCYPEVHLVLSRPSPCMITVHFVSDSMSLFGYTWCPSSYRHNLGTLCVLDLHSGYIWCTGRKKWVQFLSCPYSLVQFMDTTCVLTAGIGYNCVL